MIGVMAGFLAMMAMVLMLRPLFGADGPAFTSVFQGSVRWNGFVLLAAANVTVPVVAVKVAAPVCV